MRRTLVSLVVTAALLVPGPAGADGGRLRDPDEKPFCENPDPCPDRDYIDFDRLSFGHGSKARILQHGIHTRERWKTKDMGGRHGVTIYITIDGDGDAAADRMLRMRRLRGELWARMFRGKRFRKEIGPPLRVWRPSRFGIKVRFPLRLLGDDVESYRWRAGWSQRGVACAGSCHSDFAPQRGWFEHRL